MLSAVRGGTGVVVVTADPFAALRRTMRRPSKLLSKSVALLKSITPGCLEKAIPPAVVIVATDRVVLGGLGGAVNTVAGKVTTVVADEVGVLGSGRGDVTAVIGGVPSTSAAVVITSAGSRDAAAVGTAVMGRRNGRVLTAGRVNKLLTDVMMEAGEVLLERTALVVVAATIGRLVDVDDVKVDDDPSPVTFRPIVVGESSIEGSTDLKIMSSI